MEKQCRGMVHKIVAGDTLYKISKQYGVRLIDVLKQNPYVNVYNLQIGDEICIPVNGQDIDEKRYYIAQPGDTIESIMNKTGSNIATLFEKNAMLYKLPVAEGTIINIPVRRNLDTK